MRDRVGLPFIKAPYYLGHLKRDYKRRGGGHSLAAFRAYSCGFTSKAGRLMALRFEVLGVRSSRGFGCRREKSRSTVP